MSRTRPHLWGLGAQRSKWTLTRVLHGHSHPLPTVDIQLSGCKSCPHLVHTDIVPKRALDHWRVVIDIQNGHL